LLGGAPHAPMLADLGARMAAGQMSEKIRNACTYALGNVEGQAAAANLSVLRSKLKGRGARREIDKALGAAADREGVTKADLLETTVPAHELDASGRRELAVDGSTAVLALEGKGDVAISWRGAARRNASVVAAAKEITKTLKAERFRLEELLAEGRTWPYARWHERYLGHPVTGFLARRLIWRV